jgi:predicted MPP superfamily phosphohydrolase
MSWLGVTVGFGLFGTLLYGFGNKYKFRVIHQKLKFSNLPKAFHGLRIVHISDIHCGSFFEQKAIEDGVKMINEQKADLILFTGDIVNNLANELEPHASIFARLESPMGVYSVLGNHDYGDYVRWPEGGTEKRENLERLMELQKNMGWKLLMNEHEILEKDGEKIAIIGIENWGAKVGFKQYGKLHEAYPGTEQIPFKILMSHDPSHWKSQVKKDYPDIDLTLSGHTHGMQFGVEVPGLKWSPIQYVYKEWAGLYEEDNMKLYVNRGFGFLGYPGRVGVLPEITVIELLG